MHSRPLGALAGVLDDIVDPMIGIVRRIEERSRDPADPDIFHFEAQAADTAAFGVLPNFGFTSGASVDKERAIAKATGEAIERYCAAIFDPADMPLTSAGSGDLPCIDPADFTLYLPEQFASAGFPFTPFDKKTVLRWSQMHNLITGNIAFAPAALVWIPYQSAKVQGEAEIAQSISTGLACHETPDKAALAGLCEVIERDAFTIFWQARLEPPCIRTETIPESALDYVRRFEANGDKVFLFDLTTDIGVPTVLSVLRASAPSRPAFVFAAATDIDPELAVMKALEELDGTRRYSAYTLRSLPAPLDEHEFAGVYQQAHHIRLAADHANVDRFEFVFRSTRSIEFSEIPSMLGKDSSKQQSLVAVARAIAAVGLTPYVADLTSPDVRELGLSVVRALVPGLHPLAVGHRIRARANPRLYEVPAKLGYPALTFGAPDNPFPHPYP